MDSNVIKLESGGVNVFKSRSTVIALTCVVAFIIFSWMVMNAGYFDAGYGAAGLMFLSSVVKFALDHQAKGTPPETVSSTHTTGGKPA